jgi:dethiobiotin synthetase
VAAGLARLLAERGEPIGVMKPAETGHDGAPDALPSDAALLAEAARTAPELQRHVAPFVYREPLAPLVAARRAERPVEMEAMVDAYEALRRSHAGRMIVEGAGGLSVPLTEALDMAGLAARFDWPLLVVTRPALGTLNHTFLTVRYARERGLRVLGLVLCGWDEDTDSVAEKTNPAMMEELCDAPVLGRVPRRARGIDTAADAAEVVRAGGVAEALDERFSETGAPV